MAPAFRKPKQRNFRKRRDAEVDGAEDGGKALDGSESADLEALADVRCLQAARARVRPGMSADDLARGTAAREAAERVAAERAAAERAAAADAAAAGADDPEALRANFAATEDANGAEEDAEDPRLKAYLKEEMAKRGLLKETPEEIAAREAAEAAKGGSVYAVPERLRTEAAQDDTEQMDFVAGGMAEVALPVEYKLKNIEETERAKARLMAKKGGKGGGEGGNGARSSGRGQLPASASANFNAHSAEHARKMRDKHGHRGDRRERERDDRGDGGGRGGRGRRSGGRGGHGGRGGSRDLRTGEGEFNVASDAEFARRFRRKERDAFRK